MASSTPDAAGGHVLNLDWLNAGVCLISKSLHVTFCNTIAHQWFTPPTPPSTECHLNQCFKEGSEEYQLILDLVRTEKAYRDTVVTWDIDGQIRHVLLDSFPCQDEAGHTVGMYVMMRDLGNIVALEQQMQRTDKLATVGKIAAGIAHEIRNPLTTIKGFLQMFERRFRDAGQADDLLHIQMMLAEIDRVNMLVSELLLLSKPRQMDKQPCCLKELCLEIGSLIQSEALLRGIEYQLESDSYIPPVIADEAMIKQVIMNLAKNAIEAMENGGILKISVQCDYPWVRMDVSDTGPGIPYYQFDKIFDAFFTTKEKGTGLGLPICQRIITNHGGEIRVSSKGFGTTFTVLLPCTPPQLTVDSVH